MPIEHFLRKLSTNGAKWHVAYVYKICEIWEAPWYWAPESKITRVIPKVSGLDILDNNIFHNLYISEMEITDV